MSYSAATYPYSSVLRITDTIGTVSYQASGVLISPDEILTASHVVYQTGVGTAFNIVATQGFAGGLTGYGATIHYLPINDANDLISNQQSQFDFAVIHLSAPLPGAGTMGLLANYAGGSVSATGYPATANGTQVTYSEQVTRDRNFTLLDGGSTGRGSSGGPLWVDKGAGPQVVGVVSSESGTTGYNGLITTSVFNQIEAWVAADDGTPAPAATPPAAPTTAPPAAAGYVNASGVHTDYIVANAGGSLYLQDLVAGRDGTNVDPGVLQVNFADGVGRFDATGNAEQVARLYKAAFDRTADLGGLNTWTAQIDQAHLNLAGVAADFVTAPELSSHYGTLDNAGFVSQLYQNVLGRAGDPGGMASWQANLANGLSRGEVLKDFSESLENRTHSQPTVGDDHLSEAYRLYQAAFARTPDSGGLQSWTNQLDQGVSVATVAAGMANSPEFAALYNGLDATGTVNRFYQNVLHRAGDPGGIANWVGQLQSGQTVASVLVGFADSTENKVGTAGATHDSWIFLPS